MNTSDDQAWQISAASRFQRDLDHLPPRIARAVVEFVTVVLPANPERMSKPLRGDLEGYRSARRGDYRVLLRLDDQTHTLVLHRVTHRAHIYRPR